MFCFASGFGFGFGDHDGMRLTGWRWRVGVEAAGLVVIIHCFFFVNAGTE